MGVLKFEWKRMVGSVGFAVALIGATTAASGCYSPELKDCVVACMNAADCAPGQACGDDGWCAGGEQAGQCEDPGGEPPVPMGDELRVVIEGQGQVEMETSSLAGPPMKETCTSSTAAGTTCTYPMPAGMWATLRQKEGGGWLFDGWASPGCTFGKPKSCLVRTGMGSTVVGAKFLGP